MSEQSPYERLGVAEGASFEEIQSTRARLLQEHASDPQKTAQIEAAYDAVLMQRLKLRQEGKIKVPDGIRFAEQNTPTPNPATDSPSQGTTPAWIANLLDRPGRWDLILPAIVYLALVGLVAFFPGDATVQQFAMVVATGSSLYFLYRKESRLGRSVLLSFVALVGGFFLGSLVYVGLKQVVPSLPEDTIVISWTTFVILWGVSSFLK